MEQEPEESHKKGSYFLRRESVLVEYKTCYYSDSVSHHQSFYECFIVHLENDLWDTQKQNQYTIN